MFVRYGCNGSLNPLRVCMTRKHLRIPVLAFGAFVRVFGAAADASAQTTALYVHSDPGAYVASGRDLTYQAPDAVVTVYSDYLHTPIDWVRFHLATADPAVTWDVTVHS